MWHSLYNVTAYDLFLSVILSLLEDIIQIYNLVKWIVDSICANGVSIISTVFEFESDSTFFEINGTRLVGNYSFNISGGKNFDAKFTSEELISASNFSFCIEFLFPNSISDDDLIIDLF